MLAIILAFLFVVFSYQPLTAPSRPRHAQPHQLHNPHLWVFIFLYVSSPEGHAPIFRCVFHLALLVAVFFLYMILPTSRPSCYPYLPSTSLVYRSWLLRVLVRQQLGSPCVHVFELQYQNVRLS